jgi:hypothetical protein
MSLPSSRGSNTRFNRTRPWIAQAAITCTTLFTAGLTWAASGTASAAEANPVNPMMVEAGISSFHQGCSGALSHVLEWDSMLFAPSSPCGGGFRAFDLAFLAVVALIVISAIRFRHATTGRRLELARRMVEKGLEPPPELVGAHNGSDLRRGLVLVFTGVGLLLASSLGGGGELSPAGLIPGFIGIGYLVSHRFAVHQGAPHNSRDGGRS